MAERDEADLRKQLRETTDPELVRQRDQLEKGEPQPQLERVNTEPLLREQIELAVEDSIEIPFKADVRALLEGGSDKELRSMLVVRERSLTDNLFRVILELGAAGSFGDPREKSEAPRLADLHFFDHVTNEEHRPGMVVASEEVLGHWFIDAGPSLAWLVETGAADQELALRVSTLQIHQDEKPTVGFTLGGVSLDLVAGVR